MKRRGRRRRRRRRITGCVVENIKYKGYGRCCTAEGAQVACTARVNINRAGCAAMAAPPAAALGPHRSRCNCRSGSQAPTHWKKKKKKTRDGKRKIISSRSGGKVVKVSLFGFLSVLSVLFGSLVFFFTCRSALIFRSPFSFSHHLRPPHLLFFSLSLFFLFPLLLFLSFFLSFFLSSFVID